MGFWDNLMWDKKKKFFFFFFFYLILGGTFGEVIIFSLCSPVSL